MLSLAPAVAKGIIRDSSTKNRVEKRRKKIDVVRK